MAKTQYFEAAEVKKPEVKAGHVLVKIAASTVNTVDSMIRKMGKELPLSPDTPAILGMDIAGTVEAVGDGVEGNGTTGPTRYAIVVYRSGRKSGSATATDPPRIQLGIAASSGSPESVGRSGRQPCCPEPYALNRKASKPP